MGKEMRRFEEFRRKSLNELLLAYLSAFALMASGFILLFALYISLVECSCD